MLGEWISLNSINSEALGSLFAGWKMRELLSRPGQRTEHNLAERDLQPQLSHGLRGHQPGLPGCLLLSTGTGLRLRDHLKVD